MISRQGFGDFWIARLILIFKGKKIIDIEHVVIMVSKI